MNFPDFDQKSSKLQASTFFSLKSEIIIIVYLFNVGKNNMQFQYIVKNSFALKTNI